MDTTKAPNRLKLLVQHPDGHQEKTVIKVDNKAVAKISQVEDLIKQRFSFGLNSKLSLELEDGFALLPEEDLDVLNYDEVVFVKIRPDIGSNNEAGGQSDRRNDPMAFGTTPRSGLRSSIGTSDCNALEEETTTVSASQTKSRERKKRNSSHRKKSPRSTEDAVPKKKAKRNFEGLSMTRYDMILTQQVQQRPEDMRRLTRSQAMQISKRKSRRIESSESVKKEAQMETKIPQKRKQTVAVKEEPMDKTRPQTPATRVTETKSAPRSRRRPPPKSAGEKVNSAQKKSDPEPVIVKRVSKKTRNRNGSRKVASVYDKDLDQKSQHQLESRVVVKLPMMTFTKAQYEEVLLRNVLIPTISATCDGTQSKGVSIVNAEEKEEQEDKKKEKEGEEEEVEKEREDEDEEEDEEEEGVEEDEEGIEEKEEKNKKLTSPEVEGNNDAAAKDSDPLPKSSGHGDKERSSRQPFSFPEVAEEDEILSHNGPQLSSSPLGSERSFSVKLKQLSRTSSGSCSTPSSSFLERRSGRLEMKEATGSFPMPF